MDKIQKLLETFDYTEEDYKHLCIYAFDVVIVTLKKLDLDKLKFPEKFKQTFYPLFVTWTIGEEKTLRGCIGTFNTDDIEKNLLTYAYYSAFKDSRFSPISNKEVPQLHCRISLLVKFESGLNALDWEIGKHGISIDFRYGFRSHHATFLPEIALQQGWDKKSTLLNLVKKSGYYGRLEEIIDLIKLTRYQSIKTEITHNEYRKYKMFLKDFEFVY